MTRVLACMASSALSFIQRVNLIHFRVIFIVPILSTMHRVQIFTWQLHDRKSFSKVVRPNFDVVNTKLEIVGFFCLFQSDDSDIWDDTALIKAYDKAVASFKV